MSWRVALACCAALVGCTPLERAPQQAGVNDGGGPPEASPSDCVEPFCSWSTDDDSRCVRATMPTEALRPAPIGAAEPEMPPIYLGFSRLSSQAEPASAPEPADDGAGDALAGTVPFGFDLDGQCTNVAGCVFDTSCTQPNAAPMPDGPYCADNAYARLHAEAVSAAGEGTAQLELSDAAINCSLRAGRYNQVLRLTGYNGSAQDDQVRVDFYASTGIDGRAAEDSSAPCQEGDAGAWAPGTKFRILENDLSAPMSTAGGMPNSKIVASNAFVRDGYLLAFLPNGYEIKLFAENERAPAVQFNLRHALLVGRLARGADGMFRIENGAIAGRQAAQDVLRSFGQVGVCEQGDHAALHAAIREYMKDYSDVSLEPDAAASSACDGVSTAFRFEAAAVTPGSIAPERQVLNCCLPENAGRGACPEMRCGNGEVDEGEACDIAIAAGEEGACPSTCVSSDPCRAQSLHGEGCNARCVFTPVAEPQDGDGCCPDGATAASDDDCDAVCGNGVVEAAKGELCDPPDTCPRADSCETGSQFCAVTRYVGSPETCDARCETISNESCANDDGCCSPGCDSNTDNDCSATCGNGQVDPLETCDGDCPTSCAGSGGDACTTVNLIGTAAQCSAQCVTWNISRCADGDGCCPQGCNGTNDDDCGTFCGNGIPEPGEECDDANAVAGDGCDQCVRETPQRTCDMLIGDVSGVSSACLDCMCEQCAKDVLGCMASGSADDRRTCGDLAVCRLRTWCVGLDCYTPDGPCKREVEAAGMSTNLVTLISRSTNYEHRFGRASLVEICSQERCESVCKR